MNSTAERAIAQAYTDSQIAATTTAIQGTPGATGGVVTVTKYHSTLTDNTATDSLSISLPNATGGGAVKVTVIGTLGDGDASDIREYTVAVSRIAGANALAAISSAAVVGAVTGATANSATTLTLGSVSGGTTATNSFKLSVKVTRSTGTSTGHTATVRAVVYTNQTGQVTVAALA